MAELQPQSFDQQQQQQQPVLVYPNTQTKHPPSYHSNGSFGTLFIVLAIILVVSAFACFLGRLCNRRIYGQKPKHDLNHNLRPIGRDPNFHPKEGDIEFGFDKRIGASKPVKNGGSKRHIQMQQENGKMRSERKQGDHHGELKAGG